MQIWSAIIYASKIALTAAVIFPTKLGVTSYFFDLQDIALTKISDLALRSFLIFFAVGLFCYAMEMKILKEQKQRISPEQRQAARDECLRQLREISNELPKGKRLDLK